jgi:hypothetical protein
MLFYRNFIPTIAGRKEAFDVADGFRMTQETFDCEFRSMRSELLSIQPLENLNEIQKFRVCDSDR